MLKRIKSSIREVRKLTMCKKCYSFYYKNTWHFEAPIALQEKEETEIPVKFAQCNSCAELEVAMYERDTRSVEDVLTPAF